MRRALTTIATIAALLLLAAPVMAQTPTFTYTALVFAPGADPATAAPIATVAIPSAVVTCSADIQLPPTVQGLINPMILVWTQEELPGQVCRADLSGVTIWRAIQAGGPYPFAAVVANEIGASPRGVGENPFRRMDVPARLKTVRVVK